jgi:hypothetical protein
MVRFVLLGGVIRVRHLSNAQIWVSQYERSGLSQLEFAARHRLGLSTLRNMARLEALLDGFYRKARWARRSATRWRSGRR